MAVTFDVATTLNAAGTTSSPAPFSHTVTGSGGNRFLVVAVSFATPAGASTGVTYNGVAMTLIRRDVAGANSVNESWGLVNPATGAHNVAVTNGGGFACDGVIAMSFTNVDQTTPTGGGATATGTSATASVNQTSTLATDLVLDFLRKDATATATVGAGQTVLANFNANSRKLAASIEPGNAGTVTMSWTFTSTTWATHTYRLLNQEAAVPVAVGQAEETDTAQTITPVQGQIVAIGMASETDLAQSIALPATLVVAVGQAEETDTAQSITAVQAQLIPIGIATETDIAQTIQEFEGQIITIGQALETDTALSINAAGQAPSRMVGIRELPPLRLSVEVLTPSGRYHRWADDEPKPENVPSGLRQSSTMPGGFETFDCTLPRKDTVQYDDLDRLTRIRVLGAGQRVAGQFRLERTPSVSGDQMAISPSASGYQAYLEDDKSARELYLDQDQTKWQGPSRTRRISLESGEFPPIDPAVIPDVATGLPAIELAIAFPQASPFRYSAEAWYVSPVDLGRIYAQYQISAVGGFYQLNPWIADDDAANGQTNPGNFAFSSSGVIDYSKTGRAAFFQWLYNDTPAGADGQVETARMMRVAVYGDQGLTTVASPNTPAGALLASEIVAHAVDKYAPTLTIDYIQASGFPIDQAAFLDSTTGGEIVRQMSRFELQDWAVWEDAKFVWHQRGARGRTWRARMAPTQLDQTGPQLDRLWESIVVQYTDVDGRSRTVGPPGSGADTEDSTLHDSDPLNPANEAGITRRDLLTMGTATSSGAIQIGQRFLSEQKLLDSSGRANLVGHVTDDRGIIHPAWAVRAGDTIEFIDASDKSPRRIVKADYSHDTRTCSVDLDAPPEGLAALLERLGVALSPLGVG